MAKAKSGQGKGPKKAAKRPKAAPRARPVEHDHDHEHDHDEEVEADLITAAYGVLSMTSLMAHTRGRPDWTGPDVPDALSLKLNADLSRTLGELPVVGSALGDRLRALPKGGRFQLRLDEIVDVAFALVLVARRDQQRAASEPDPQVVDLLETIGDAVNSWTSTVPNLGLAVDDDVDDVEGDEDGEGLPELTDEIFRVKVTLNGIKPPIWRRFLVPDCTLGMLHDVLQVVMGWENAHLYEFRFGKRSFIPTDPAGFLDDEDPDSLSLSQIAEQSGAGPRAKSLAKLVYTYDLGDDWEHEVVIEKVVPREPGVDYPMCLEGAGACPLEDIGGVWGYEELIRVMANPKAPDPNEYRKWVKASFDPAAFDVADINERFHPRPKARKGKSKKG